VNKQLLPPLDRSDRGSSSTDRPNNYSEDATATNKHADVRAHSSAYASKTATSESFQRNSALNNSNCPPSSVPELYINTSHADKNAQVSNNDTEGTDHNQEPNTTKNANPAACRISDTLLQIAPRGVVVSGQEELAGYSNEPLVVFFFFLVYLFFLFIFISYFLLAYFLFSSFLTIYLFIYLVIISYLFIFIWLVS
jgi:hypothetical protein